METLELFERLAVALAVGLLIGLERGWQARDDQEGERSAGVRTYALASLLGAVWGAISNQTGIGGAVSLGVAFFIFSAAITLFRYRETSHDRTFGATSVVAAMLAFALGALCVVGDMQAAVAVGVAATALLALKNLLHAWLQRLTWPELRSSLVLLVMTCIMLPWAPRRPIDPWGLIHPFEIWLLTIMVAAVSFAGYVAIKIIGEKAGAVAAGIAGGVASSTAVTVTMARFAVETPERGELFIAGALIASVTMALRVIALVALFNAALLPRVVMPLGIGAAVLALISATFLSRNTQAPEERNAIVLRNPLDVVAVLQFGLLFMVVSALAKLATKGADVFGAYALSTIAGLADVDAITLSIARLDSDTLGPGAAATSICLAVVANMAAKTAMASWIAGVRFGGRLLAASALAVFCGGLALYLAPL